MSFKEIQLSGGESVYCINEAQLQKALEMVSENPESSSRLNDFLHKAENELSRNECAALAFVMIDRLRNNI